MKDVYLGMKEEVRGIPCLQFEGICRLAGPRHPSVAPVAVFGRRNAKVAIWQSAIAGQDTPVF
jgi:hypothetical protein